jgi:disulfide bond formation protein DsbB
MKVEARKTMLRTRRWPDKLSQDALLLAWGASCAGLLGGLYFSEVRGFVPGALCWAQRVCLWPLVLILGLAWRARRPDVAAFVLPQVGVGTLLATYQVFVQHLSRVDPSASGPSCMVKAEIGLGPISIPMLSLAAHLLTGLLLLAAWHWRPRAAAAAERALGPSGRPLVQGQGGAR